MVTFRFHHCGEWMWEGFRAVEMELQIHVGGDMMELGTSLLPR